MTSLPQLPLRKPKREMRKPRIRNPSRYEYRYLNALRYHIYSMYPPLIQQGFIHGHDSFYCKVKMWLPATQSISSSPTGTNFKFLLRIITFISQKCENSYAKNSAGHIRTSATSIRLVAQTRQYTIF